MKKNLVLFVFLAIVSCSDDDFGSSVEVPSQLMKDAQKNFKSITSLPADDISKDKIELGKLLYHDASLSTDGKISCASCHPLDNFGVDNKQFSDGVGGLKGGRNSPSSVYAFLHNIQFWDGRAATVEEQAGGPLLNPVEHGFEGEKGKREIEEIVGKNPKYKEMFKNIYGENSITFANITDAIGGFERQLMPVSKFDRFLKNDTNGWSQQELDGLSIFMDKGCVSCHGGIAVGGKIAVKFEGFKTENETDDDRGMYDREGEKFKIETNKYRFKVSSLRNVAETYPYFHDGSVKDLKEAIKVMSDVYKIPLKDSEIVDIEAFLKTLTADVDSKYIM